MHLENDSPEAFTDIDDISSTSGTTLNVWGGIGGQGGRGGQEGGTGGKGEGPTFHVSGAVGQIVHVSDRDINTDGPHKISLCDIYLQREVYLNNPQSPWRRRRKAVKKYYTAEVKDKKEMTVVLYEGQDAEEEFKKDVAKYMKFRHPSFLQLYGIVHSGNNYASIFYDVLIPWRDIRRIYRHSPLVLCYIYACVRQFTFHSSSKTQFSPSANQDHCTFLIRPSTGRLCIDLERPDGPASSINVSVAENISPMSLSLLSTIDTQIIIDNLTIERLHGIYYLYFTDETWYYEFPPMATVHLAAVYHTDLGNPVASLNAPTLGAADCHLCSNHWYLVTMVDPLIMGSGWNRYAVSELISWTSPGTGTMLYLWARLQNSDLWLSQANHILNRLGVFSNTNNYALLHSVRFRVELEPKPQAAPGQTDWHSLDAFLFLCPPESFPVGPLSFKCPECVGYWSFDPSGLDRLSSEQAAELGFPKICSSVEGIFWHWSDTVYASLRQFHQGKGFDPDSQDLARHLGHPLYELYSEYNNSMDIDDGDFGAHIEEVSSTDTDQPMDVDQPGNLI
ncbi:hypothetical protein R3P38DRAFT_2621983 [Favolaschia claudopus]|uniref:Uncharacterized protein n=1 Tax=Favolaschia claudopus TaxID=2862362 RepID=A0AAW0BSZ3_9AGAR